MRNLPSRRVKCKKKERSHERTRVKGGMFVRKSKKAMDILVALVLLVFACVCFFSFYGNAVGLGRWQEALIGILNEEWGFYTFSVFAALTAVYGLFLFLRSLTVKTRERSIRIKHGDGEVYLTESSVRSVVACTVKNFTEVTRPEVFVDIHGGKDPTIRSKITCGVAEVTNLDALAESIQGRVRENLENYVGYPVGDVEVTLTEPGEVKTEQVAG